MASGDVGIDGSVDIGTDLSVDGDADVTGEVTAGVIPLTTHISCCYW